MKYKVGQYRIFRYVNSPIGKPNQYKKGELVKMYIDDVLIGQYEVIKSNQFKILGKITNTYGHKRKSTKIS